MQRESGYERSAHEASSARAHTRQHVHTRADERVYQHEHQHEHAHGHGARRLAQRCAAHLAAPLVALLVACSDAEPARAGASDGARQQRAQSAPAPRVTPDDMLADTPRVDALPDSRPSAQPIARPARTLEQQRAIDAWREAIELAQPASVLEEGLALVRADGALARDAEAAALVARALAQSARGEEAEVLLARDSFPEPERGWTEIERARRRLDADDVGGVYAILTLSSGPDGRSVQIRHANFPESWLLVARAYARAGESAKAAKLAQRFVELDPLHPDSAIAWHLLLSAARARGDTAAAQRYETTEREVRTWRAYFDARRRQVREHPEDPLPRFGVASCWMQVREYERAEIMLADLVERAPDYCRAWFHLGEARRLRANMAGAHAAWTRALACDPNDHRSRFNRAQAAVIDGRANDAEEDFRALLDTPAAANPQFSGMHLWLARRALERGDSKAAEHAYDAYRKQGGAEPLRP